MTVPSWSAAADPVEAALPELYALTSIEQFPARAVDVTRRVLGGDKALWTEVDRATGDFRTFIDPAPSQLEQLRDARVAFMPQHPVMNHALAGHPIGARLMSDFLTRREFHRLGLYGEFFEPLGVEDQLTVMLTRPTARRLAGVSVDRGRSGFDDADRITLTRLRPHLAAAHANAIRFSSTIAAHASEADHDASVAVERLTDRQREVLGHIAAGKTNAQIAQALDLSFDTVRKHVENILVRLGVSNRTSAAITHARAAVIVSGEWTASEKSMFAPTPLPAS